jgi:hypothetical protein
MGRCYETSVYLCYGWLLSHYQPVHQSRNTIACPTSTCIKTVCINVYIIKCEFYTLYAVDFNFFSLRLQCVYRSKYDILRIYLISSSEVLNSELLYTMKGASIRSRFIKRHHEGFENKIQTG